jgi:aspartate/methionine/tyrosine aminotransferase
MEYVQELIEEAGVAIVPGRGFFHCEALEKYMRRYVRVAFCKHLSTLRAAGEAMKNMKT